MIASHLSRKRFLVECVVICLLIAAGTFAVYRQAGDFGFLQLDDAEYVTKNAHVLAGLTLDGVRWSLGSFYESLWQPLVMISYMADVELYGIDSGAFHLTNLVLHILNALLLFVFLAWTTGHPRRSGFVAAMFALHPLHVESVAWIAERKDVLSTLFWLLAMLAYVWYARRPGVGRYLLVVLPFALGLMAKAMLVTLPIVLLLLDYWPLRREKGPGNREQKGRGLRLGRLALEKAPLLALSAVSCIVTVLAQASGGAVIGFRDLAMGERILNALRSYVLYAWKMIVPSGLACYYPLTEHIPIWQGAACGAALALATCMAIRARAKPYLAVGWLWYVVTLVPVVGLVQVGMQSMADRYMYIPSIGLLVMLAWGLPGALESRWPARSDTARPAMAVAAVLLVAYGLAAYRQVGFWRNEETLFRQAIAVTRDNWFAHYNLGSYLRAHQRVSDAAREFGEAFRIKPGEVMSRANYGAALIDTGRPDEAVKVLEAGVRKHPRCALIHNNLGIAYAALGREREAVREFNAALRITPDYESARRNLAVVLGED